MLTVQIMYFRTATKFIRTLQLNNFYATRYGPFYNSFSNQPSLNAVYSSKQQTKSTRNPERKLASSKLKPSKKTDDYVFQTPYHILEKPLSIEETKSHCLQPSSLGSYYTSDMPNVNNLPEEVPLRRKFEKSSTQNAITKPLKLPRLAHPFPEPVKHQMSQQVSDEEKATLMQQQAKMEAQYRLQQQQESQQQFMQEQQFRRQQECEEQEEAEPQCKQVSPRASRFVKGIRTCRVTQDRQYSSAAKIIHPEVLSEVEQCDLVLERLKQLYPESEHMKLKKPVCIPGSAEEKEFVRNTLKYIAKLKVDKKREPAPFPSYSEVKTFVRKPADVKFTAEGTNKPLLNASGPLSTISCRDYATSSGSCGPKSKSSKKACDSMRLPGCKARNPLPCGTIIEKPCTKLEAPYPSYSECMDDPEEGELSECKICPSPKEALDQVYGKNSKKQYSTCTNIDIDAASNPKRYPPCSNPGAEKKPCDYVGTARKNTIKRRSWKHNRTTRKVKTSSASPNLFEKIKSTLGFQNETEEIQETPQEPREIHIIEVSNDDLMTSRNIPGFMMCDGTKDDCGRPPSDGLNCPKSQKSIPPKSKCRKLKKRKVPHCDDVKNKKAAPEQAESMEEPPYTSDGSPAQPITMYQPIQVNKTFEQVDTTPEQPEPVHVELASPTTQPITENIPYKLKPQFWK